ncbi:MAG: hypothetical protein IIC60_10540 [Proteobacteria bacterium]|nr:hypothetical protein [Pseudomonadota bacterium]
MLETDLSYALVSEGFIVLLNIMVTMGLWLNYRTSRNPYLLMACVAGVVESLRQIPDIMLTP